MFELRMHYPYLLRLNNLACRRRPPLSRLAAWSSKPAVGVAIPQWQRQWPLLPHHSHDSHKTSDTNTQCGSGDWSITTRRAHFGDRRKTTKSALHAVLRSPFSSSSSSSSSSMGCCNNSMQRLRCFSTATTPSNSNDDNKDIARKSQNKLVLGSHKWASMDATRYCEIVHTALLNGISTIEAGQGADALRALHQCLSSDELLNKNDNTITQPSSIRILQRVGYRTTLRLPPPPPPPPTVDDDDDHDHDHDVNDAWHQPPTISSSSSSPSSPTEAVVDIQQGQAAAAAAATTTFTLLPGDVIVEEVPVSAEDASSSTKPVPGAPRCSKPSTTAAATSTRNIPAGSTTVVLHNISAAGIHEAMSTSPFITTPLLTLCNDDGNQNNNKKVETVFMLHNPEAQGGAINQADGSSSSASTTSRLGGLIIPTSLTSSNTYSNSNNNTPSSPRQGAICARLVESFVALEKAVQDGQIASYGIVSNGLGLPDSHPLHLSWGAAIRPALERAFQMIKNTNANDADGNTPPPRRQLLHFSILELPVNLIETTGLHVARQVHQDLQQDDDFRNMFANNSSSSKSSPIEMFAMRPLSAYPDLGTGQDGHSLVLADYLLPTLAVSTNTTSSEVAAGERDAGRTMTTTSSDAESPPPPQPPRMQWSHTMSSPPDIYNVALQSAMAHFDAEAILEAQQERLAQGEKADLTAEERETLDGCKLMQSLLHDVDVGLDKMRSFAVHERELTRRIIPLIYDTFEEYDDDTAQVLQTFFAAYSLAVRYAIAKNTRQLLLHGEKLSLAAASSASSNIPVFKDLHPDMKLQEYAIGFILKQQLNTLLKRQETTNDINADVASSDDGAGTAAAQSEAIRSYNDVIDKIVIGCTDPDQVIDDLELVYQYYARTMQEQKEACIDAET